MGVTGPAVSIHIGQSPRSDPAGLIAMANRSTQRRSVHPVSGADTFKRVPANSEPRIEDFLRHTSGMACGELTANTPVKDAYTKAKVFRPSVPFDE